MSWVDEGGGTTQVTASSGIPVIFFSFSPAALLPLMIGLEEEKPPKLVQAFHTCSKDMMFIALVCEDNQMGAP